MLNPLPPPKRNTTFKGDVLRLVFGTGIAQGISILAAPVLIRLCGQILFDNGRYIISNVTIRELWDGLNRYKKNPLCLTQAGLLKNVVRKLPVLMLGNFFQLRLLPFMFWVFELYRCKSLIGQSLSNVFLQHLAEAKKYR